MYIYKTVAVCVNIFLSLHYLYSHGRIFYLTTRPRLLWASSHKAKIPLFLTHIDNRLLDGSVGVNFFLEGAPCYAPHTCTCESFGII